MVPAIVVIPSGRLNGPPLSANISETLTLPEFSVEGGEGIDDGNDGCYAIIYLGGGSDDEAHTAAIYNRVRTVKA